MQYFKTLFCFPGTDLLSMIAPQSHTFYICRYAIKPETIATNKANAWTHLRLCERLLPRNCMTTALHTLAHAWEDIQNFGPWYVFWTLPLERYMKYMRANIYSGAYPAANFVTRAKRMQRLAYLSPPDS